MVRETHHSPYCTLSIITATYNAAKVLSRLINSLVAQTDQDFEWVVADGASNDGTLQLLEQAKRQLKRVIIDSREDFGIYDALNRAIKLASGGYYLTLGADDLLFSDAVANYKAACQKSRADFVTALVEVEGKICGPRKPEFEWLYDFNAYTSSHAVGVAIRRDLHKRMGLYSKRFPIVADRLFILKAIRGGAKVKKVNFVAGRFENGGTSGSDILGALTERLRVQVEVGHSLWLQLIIFILRVIKHRSRILKSLGQ